MSSPRRALLAVAASLLATGATLTAPTATAATSATTEYYVSYGNTYTRGVLTWNNRSVTLDGYQQALSSSGCRTTTLYTLDSHGGELGHATSKVTCNAVEKITFSAPANVRGGAASATVCFGGEVNLCYRWETYDK